MEIVICLRRLRGQARRRWHICSRRVFVSCPEKLMGMVVLIVYRSELAGPMGFRARRVRVFAVDDDHGVSSLPGRFVMLDANEERRNRKEYAMRMTKM